jgi:cell division transport system permease protein
MASTLSVLSGTFFIICVVFLLQQNIESLITRWGSEIKVNVYLSDKADGQAKESIERELKAAKLFTNLEYISKAEAAKKLHSRLGGLAPSFLVEADFDNPLPESFELKLESSGDISAQYERLVLFAKKLLQNEIVEDVSYGQEWVSNYAQAVKLIKVAFYITMLIVLGGALLIIGNAIRSAIYQQRDEIEILELFGATRNAIITPYVFEGAILGLFASILALIFTFALYSWFAESIKAELSFWNLTDQLIFLSPKNSLVFIISCTFIGGLGSYLSVRQVCTGWAASEGRVS